jgi:hypothetical protein
VPCEFDTINGLTGLAAHLLRHDPGSPCSRRSWPTSSVSPSRSSAVTACADGGPGSRPQGTARAVTPEVTATTASLTASQAGPLALALTTAATRRTTTGWDAFLLS